MSNGTKSPDTGAPNDRLGKVSLGLGLLCWAGFVALFFTGLRLGSFDFRLDTGLSRLYIAINYSLLPLAVLAIILGHVSRGRLRQGGHSVGAIPAGSGLALGYFAVLIFVMTLYLRDEPPRRRGREVWAANHLQFLHGALSGFANRHVSHTFPARLDQLLVSEDEYHNKLVEGRYSITRDPLNDSQGYQYFYTPSTPAGDGSIAAYTVLARPQEFGPAGGRANFFIDESTVVRWTSENRPAAAGDPPWWQGSLTPANGYSVIPLETKGDEILKKISVEYLLTPVMSNPITQELKPEEILCLGDNYAAAAILHSDVALTFGNVLVPPGEYSLWIKRGNGKEWQLNVNKYTMEPLCNGYIREGDLGSVPLSEAAALKRQAKLAFNLAREGDGLVLRVQLGEKELAANLLSTDNQTIAVFARAIQFDPKRTAQPHVREAADEYERGVHLAQEGKDDQAIAAFEKVIQLDPKRFEYYKALDGLLSKRSEWQKLVSLWSQFIAQVPDNGQAYCERSGAYSHLHDLPNVLKDGDKACSLGYQECCENVKSFRSRFTGPTPLPPGVTAPVPAPRQQ